MAKTYSAGVTTAYGAAKRGGYTGTYEEFCADQANFARYAQQVREDKESVEQTVETFTEETVPEAVQSVEGKGTEQIGLVNQAGTTQVQNVNNAGTTQTDAVNLAGTTNVNAVNQAGETQVNTVNQAGATQAQAVEDKGEEVIASIPSDYSDLTAEVDDLTRQISDVEENQIPELKSALNDGYHVIDVDWARGTINNGAFSPNDYKKVSTRSAVTLNRGDILKIDSGYVLNVFIVSGSTVENPFYWGTNEYKVSVSGTYLLSITSSPAPSGDIQDINEYLVHVKCTNAADRKLIEALDFINDTVIPNIEPGKNLFNRELVTPGVLIDRSTGVEAVNVNNSASDFIRVYSGETIYKRNCGNWYSCLFDLNYNYVESLANTDDVTISQDGYIRVTVPNTNLTTAIISRTYPLPDAGDYKPSFIDRIARRDISEMSTWSNTIEDICTNLEIRDANYHEAGSVDLSEYAFASIRVGNGLGVSCTLNFYDDRVTTSTNWMKRPDGSYVAVTIPSGSSIITADDFAELPYLKYLRPIVTPASAPESGGITIQIVGRK